MSSTHLTICNAFLHTESSENLAIDEKISSDVSAGSSPPQGGTLATNGKTPSKDGTSPSPPSDASTGPSPPQGDSGSLDVAYFRKIHSDVTTRLTELCHEWEEKSASLEEQEDISEDGRDTVVAYWL